ncbi:MAG: type II secretion system minor pseudopilin GspK [Burkholderiaceae bacterium]|nr:type II secretion system minor pseudopilin GspK [Burkholderiaceae bacterium]
MKPRRRPPKGAALLVAMIVLTLVSTLAAGMVWQQARAIEVESAERTRSQAAWILSGAVDLGRVLLRLDARKPGVDHLNEVWATQLEEASLSSLLAQDRNNNVEAAPEAFLRGNVRDAQDRYNLRNLIDPATQKVVEAELAALTRLCESAAVAPQTAQILAEGLQAAWRRGQGAETEGEADGGALLAPQTVDQLVWLGLDADTVKRLRPFVDLLPEPTPLNINTASAEVLAAVIAGMDLGSAKRIETRRPYNTLQDARGDIQGEGALDPKRLSVSSNFFVISGRLRMDGRLLEERLLVKRDNRQVLALARSRQNLRPGLD